MVARLSTSQIFSILSNHVIANQRSILDSSQKINTGKKFNSAHEDPVSMIRSLQTKSKIVGNSQSIRSNELGASELELAEVSINSMKNLMDRIKEIAITGGNETLDSNTRVGMREELRKLGETIIQLANTKSGLKFIFSGEQSDEPTLSLNPGANFNATVYKNNIDNGKERFINESQSSVSLKDALITAAQSASLSNNAINPVLSTAGNLDIEVNDGNGNVTNFSVALAAADNLTNIITKVNAAFNGAGGLGSIAQESPTGYLKLDTALVTGNSTNKQAKVQILTSSSNTIVNEINMKGQIGFGKDAGIMQTLDQLEAAFAADNPLGIRNLLSNLDSNISELITAQSNIGSLVNQLEALKGNSDDLGVKLASDLSVIEDVDFVQATLDLSTAQAALSTSIQTTSNFFQQSIFNFIGSQ